MKTKVVQHVEREWMREWKLWKFSFCLTFRHCLVINKKCTRLLFVFAISWCSLLQCLGDPAGWPRWPSHLPAMTESLCFRCPHVSLPMWQTKTWPAMRPILILKILLVFMRNVSVYYLLRWYSSFLIIICMFDFYWIIHHFLILHYIIILLMECNINYL